MHRLDQIHDGRLTTREAGTALLPGIVDGVLCRRGETGWTVTPGDPWCSVRPNGAGLRAQGWKLHLSATPLSAALVLVLAAEILVSERAGFKFAGTVERLAELSGARADRGSGGKFLTVYPDDDDHFRRLAERLHDATDGLPGPGILSDRRYRPGSLVHYRYGVFGGVRVLTADGTTEVMLTAPDGSLVADRRKAWVTTPAWAPAPFPDDAAPAAAGTAAVLLDDRFVVRKAIRHAFKGGVYLGVDRDTERQVVIKEARCHVAGRIDGTDARDVLRHEAEMLDVLAPLDVGPRRLGTFVQGGNLFLVQEYVPGRTLREWVAEHPDRSLAEFLHLAGQLVGIVEKVHTAGLVLRDLNPNNLMVTPEGRLRLIDVELVARQGIPARPGYTPGYAGPEVTVAGRTTVTPEYHCDLYGLGAVLLHLVAGVDPVLPRDTPHPRPADERLVPLITLAVADHPWAAALLPPLLALTAADPTTRWPLPCLRHHLAALAGTAPTDPATSADPGTPAEPAGAPGVEARCVDNADTRCRNSGHGVSKQRTRAVESADTPGGGWERVVSDGIAYLVGALGSGRGGHLWPVSAFGATNDPLNVQHGAAGVLAVLTRAASTVDAEPGLRAAVAEATGWVRERLATSAGDRTGPAPGLGDRPDRGDRPVGNPALPGLYFGRSGTAWALLDAARLLGDDAAAADAVALAGRVPVAWPNPDVCHGAAGAGLAQVHFWRATGDTAFRDRIVACAEAVTAAAQEHPAGLIWPVPATFASSLAGARHFGFAHGVAGIGAFLLAAGMATGREDFVATARTAGDTLVSVARVDGGVATWPTGDRPADGPDRAVHWCSGSSGVGTFLVRLWLATGEPRYREAAELGAAAVRRSVWRSTTAACHGLAGDADFLLDLAAALDDPRYARWADDLAACLQVRNVVRDGLMLVPDESMVDVTAGYGTGLAGVVATLLRLRDGGTRLWLPDDLAVPRRTPAHASAGSLAAQRLPAGVA